MRFHHKIVSACLVLLLVTSSATAGAKNGVFFRNLRNIAMGGAGILSASGANAFVYNPALLTRGKISIKPLTLQLYVNGRFTDLGGFVSDHGDSLGVFTDLSPSMQDSIYNDMNDIDNQWIKIGAPLSVAVTVRNIGIAAYATTDLNFKLDKGIYEPRLYAQGINDYVVTAGFGKKLDMLLPGLKAGIALKFIQRRNTGEIKLSFSEVQESTDLVSELQSELEDPKTGFGIDLGAMYSPLEKLEVGVVFADFVGTIDDYDIGQNLKIGARYEIIKLVHAEINFVDMFNTDGASFFTKTHIGAEVDLKVLSLRGGFYQGYPSFGAGLNLLMFRLDAAMWREEFGHAPGEDGETFYGFELSLGF